MAVENVTTARVRELLSYDPEVGVLIWQVSRKGKGRPGMEAGQLDHRGYRQVFIDGRWYRSHRIAWLHYYGELPKHTIDHIDRNPLNNKIANLRDVTHAENQKNKAPPRDGVGVYPTMFGTFRAFIHNDGKQIYLGSFREREAAISARNEALRLSSVLCG